MKPWHIVVLIIVLLLVFGASKLPDVAKSIGQSLKVFKKEMSELRDDGSGGAAAAAAAAAAAPPPAVYPAAPPAYPAAPPPAPAASPPVGDPGSSASAT
ncbi:MAG: Sec-independent protein translocase subunit TatA [Bifidobacteriaceae bacterium]|jgi:sec-independent protein translocase protein TatA|nr:Sec-independent protein translocase subunit TatA [Bifidobacteriaceae bacterium]